MFCLVTKQSDWSIFKNFVVGCMSYHFFLFENYCSTISKDTNIYTTPFKHSIFTHKAWSVNSTADFTKNISVLGLCSLLQHQVLNDDNGQTKYNTILTLAWVFSYWTAVYEYLYPLIFMLYLNKGWFPNSPVTEFSVPGIILS